MVLVLLKSGLTGQLLVQSVASGRLSLGRWELTESLVRVDLGEARGPESQKVFANDTAGQFQASVTPFNSRVTYLIIENFRIEENSPVKILVFLSPGIFNVDLLAF